MLKRVVKLERIMQRTQLTPIQEEISLSQYWEKLDSALKNFDHKSDHDSEEDRESYEAQLKLLNTMLAKGLESNKKWPPRAPATYRQMAAEMNELARDQFGNEETPHVAGKKSLKFMQEVYLPNVQRFANVKFNVLEQGVMWALDINIAKRKVDAVNQTTKLNGSTKSFSTANIISLQKKYVLKKKLLLESRVQKIKVMAVFVNCMEDEKDTQFAKIVATKKTLRDFIDFDNGTTDKKFLTVVYDLALSSASRNLLVQNEDTNKPLSILKQCVAIEMALLPELEAELERSTQRFNAPVKAAISSNPASLDTKKAEKSLKKPLPISAPASTASSMRRSPK